MLTADFSGLDEYKQFLSEFEDRVQRRVCRLATKKAGKAVATQVEKLMPRQKKFGKSIDKDGKTKVREWHTADKAAQKAFNRKSMSMSIVGVTSGFGRLMHLIEQGTVKRFRKMKTQLATNIIGTKVRTRKVKLANGGFRTIKETINRTKRQGLGSKPRDPMSGPGRTTGVMPAYHILRRAVQQVNANQVMLDEIRAGLFRVLEKTNSSTE